MSVAIILQYAKNTAIGLVRRGRYLTSQTAFGGQLPYKGSLGRPAVIFDHSLFRMMVSFYEPRTTSHGFFHGDIHNRSMRHGFANCGLRMAFSPNSISRDSHNGTPSHSCPFWQPSCASCWLAPDGPKRLTGRPLRKRSGGPSANCDRRPANNVFFERRSTAIRIFGFLDILS